MSISLFFTLFSDYLYSLYFCLRVFPLKDAVKVPVNISRNIRIGSVRRGCITLSQPIRHNMLYIGHQGYEAIAETRGLVHIAQGGTLVVEGTARLAQGIRLWIDPNVTLRLGDNFYCNKNCLLRACDNITFGRDVLMGWSIEVNTTDGHTLEVESHAKPNHAPIAIGNHVWIASHVTLGKGASLPDGTVVATHSLVNASFAEPNTLIGGIPAKVLKHGVDWLL